MNSHVLLEVEASFCPLPVFQLHTKLPQNHHFKKLSQIASCPFTIRKFTLKGDLWGPVAQRLEQQTHNLLVVGSNPTGPTMLPSRPALRVTIPHPFEQLFAQRFRITMHLTAPKP
jgi:hypothetical protein